jgi:hypothetical protein
MEDLGSINLLDHRKNIIEELRRRDEEAKKANHLAEKEENDSGIQNTQK